MPCSNRTTVNDEEKRFNVLKAVCKNFNCFSNFLQTAFDALKSVWGKFEE